MRRATTLAAIALLVPTLLLACDDDSEPPTASPTPTAAATAAPTAVSTPSATATAATLPPIVQRVIDAVRARDAEAVMAAVQLTSTPCTNQQGAGGPPKCSVAGPGGAAEGTTIEAFPLGSCELGWYSRTGVRDILQSTLPGTGELYAVVRLTRPPFNEPGMQFPTTQYAAFFVRRTSGMPESSFVFAMDDDALTYVDLPCAQSAREALANPVYRGAEVTTRGPAFQP
jgi:hypothetical protein